MAHYTDIPTGEEQGLVSDTMKSVSTQNDTTNFYVKLACVGLLCVVAFMSGNVHSRNTVTSMVNYAWGNCQVVSSVRSDGFCPDGVKPPCPDGGTGWEECTQIGSGTVGCLDPDKADDFIKQVTQFVTEDVFPNGWEKKSCKEQGYPYFDRGFDFSTAMWYQFNSHLQNEYGLRTKSLIFRK